MLELNHTVVSDDNRKRREEEYHRNKNDTTTCTEGPSERRGLSRSDSVIISD